MKKIKRRHFVKTTGSLSLSLGLGTFSNLSLAADGLNNRKNGSDAELTDERHYLKRILYSKQEIDDWLAGRAFPFSTYHSQFGWLLPNARFRDGIDDSVSVYTYAADEGERLMSNYKKQPCRINTYGNSFTQCHQVSDHETWQEMLAAHLQEPVRNYGIGGWSVYQAYLRMLREEQRNPADLIIFNIYDDDHKRNLDAWRNIRVHKHPQHIEAPLPFLKVNPAKKEVIPFTNPCPTVESLYALCNLDKTFNLFKDDFVLKIILAHQKSGKKNNGDGYEALTALTKTHGISTEIDESKTLAEEAERIHLQAALFSSKYLVEKIDSYAKQEGKKLLFVLSYPAKVIAKYIREGIRFDQSFLEYLDSKQLPYIDLMRLHADDYKKYRIEIEDYLGQYFIGHYNPLGNFFCAAALKNKLVEMLNPKSLPYRLG